MITGGMNFFYNPMRKSPMLESLFDGRDNDRFRTQRNIDQYPFLLFIPKGSRNLLLAWAREE